MSEPSDQASLDEPCEAEPKPESTVEVTLDDLPDGVGCAEIWDYLSDHRRED